MEFPDESFPSDVSMGLGRSPDAGLTNLNVSMGRSGSAVPSGGMDILPDMQATTRQDDIVDNVLGVFQTGDWLEESMKAERSRPANAMDLMRTYVNIVNSSQGSQSGNSGSSGGAGTGFLISIAQGINDEETLNVITRVMQPSVENDMVTFSVLGFGQFMIVGEPDAGNLSVMDMSRGQRVDLQSGRSGNPTAGNGTAAAAERTSSATFIPNEEETLAQLVLVFLALVSNPMFLLTSACILCVWAIYKITRRLG